MVFEIKNAIGLASYNWSTYFLLDGGNEHIALGELRALMEIYGSTEHLYCLTMLCLSTVKPHIGLMIADRASYVREFGLVKRISNLRGRDYLDLRDEIAGKKVHVSVCKGLLSRELVSNILVELNITQKHGEKADVRLIFTDGHLIVGEKVKSYSYSSKHKVTLSKPIRRSLELSPDIARVLVNLTRARENSVLLDPFAGTGNVLLEAWSMGIRGVGVDIDWELVRIMNESARSISANIISIVGDSRYVVFSEVDHIATDLPYGRGASTHGVELKSLYRSFIERISEYLSKWGYASFIVPHWLEEYVDELLSTYNLRLCERYYDYVHGSLTRVINVVRKW